MTLLCFGIRCVVVATPGTTAFVKGTPAVDLSSVDYSHVACHTMPYPRGLGNPAQCVTSVSAASEDHSHPSAQLYQQLGLIPIQYYNLAITSNVVNYSRRFTPSGRVSSSNTIN